MPFPQHLSIRLPSECRTVGVAVSGGADSVALLHLAAAVTKENGTSLIVLHFNHELRGEASDGDARFVEALAESLGVPFYSERAVAPLSIPGFSLEMAARKARLAFFARAVANLKLDCILTAHHADDAAETLLLRLARGSGAAGLSGLRPESRIQIEGQSLRILRPLLTYSGAVLRRYLVENGLTWREDESNTDTAILRNAVRHTLLPAIERADFPDIRKGLTRSAAILGEEDAFLEAEVDRLWESLESSPDVLILPVQLHRALQRRMLRRWLDYVAGFDWIEDLLTEPDGIFTLPGNLRIQKAGNRYTRLASASEEPRCNDLTIERPGVYAWGRFTITCTPSEEIYREIHRPGEFPASASLTPGSLLVRTRLPGDRIAPVGLSGSQKLKDIFCDAKLPHDLRTALPVFVRAGEVVWVPGCRVARSAALSTESGSGWLLRVTQDRE